MGDRSLMVCILAQAPVAEVPTVRGEPIEFPARAAARPRTHHIVGGMLFGLGWGLVGACPGPLFALVGSGLPVMVVALLGAVGGAWV